MTFDMETQAPDLRFELLRGVDVLAAAVRANLGPAGHHVVLERADGPPLITKDTASVAKTLPRRNAVPGSTMLSIKDSGSTADGIHHAHPEQVGEVFPYGTR